MGKSSPPAAPDYTSAAQQTAQGNLDLARLTTEANRVNYNTPFGSLTYTNGQTPQPGAAPVTQQIPRTTFDAQAYLDANPDVAAQVAQGNATALGHYQKFGQAEGRPLGMQTVTSPGGTAGGNPDQWTANVSLSPDQQKLLDAQTQTQLGLAGMQNQGLDRVQQSMSSPFSLDGAPGAPSAYQGGQQLSTYGGSALPSTYTASSQPGTYQGMALGNEYDPTKDTNDAYNLMMQRIQPQMQQQEDASRTRLANQGLAVGSEAANNELNQLGRNQNDQRTAAAIQSYQLGMQQQAQTFGQHQQNISANMAQQGQTFNQGLQNIQSAMGQQAQGFNQQTQNTASGMAQQAQTYNQQAGNLDRSRTDQAQQFQQAEQLRQQGIQEQLMQRQQPLNELNALRTGSQLTMPTFGNSPQQAQVSGPNYLGAAQNQYQGDINSFNANQAQQSSTNGAVGSLATTAALFMLMSDMRIKRNVRRVGATPGGHAIYVYRNTITNTDQIGVMAQEVMQTHPHLVSRHPSGYLQVNYGGLQ